MKKKSSSKLWNRATKYVRHDTDEYAKIHSIINNIQRVTSFRAQFADVVETQEILQIAIEPPLQFARWRQETKQVKKHTEALARLLLGRDKSQWFDAKQCGSREDNDPIW